jgi:chromosome segregation ATPase
MSNILATLHQWSAIPPGAVYRGDGKFDILDLTPFTLVNVKRKDVNNAGTATFTAPGETIKTRLELRKLAQAEHKAQKLKAIALRREEVIAARYLDLTTRIAALNVSIADTQQNIATLNAQIQTITADLAASNALLATRATALATAQASLAAATTAEQIATRTATLATRQTQYDTALAARDADQTKLTTRQGNLATNEATLVTRTERLATLQATFAAFKLKRGIA